MVNYDIRARLANHSGSSGVGGTVRDVDGHSGERVD
jgi:hypothetical protein